MQPEPARSHHAVAQTGDDRVAGLNEAPETDGVLDDVFDVRTSLILVAVEESQWRAASQNPGQLPAHVAGVAQARAHALPEEGRHLMGRVAQKEDVPRAPALGHERVERVDGRPRHIHVIRVDPR
jgi:hypothetical protein